MHISHPITLANHSSNYQQLQQQLHCLSKVDVTQGCKSRLCGKGLHSCVPFVHGSGMANRLALIAPCCNHDRQGAVSLSLLSFTSLSSSPITACLAAVQGLASPLVWMKDLTARSGLDLQARFSPNRKRYGLDISAARHQFEVRQAASKTGDSAKRRWLSRFAFVLHRPYV